MRNLLIAVRQTINPDIATACVAVILIWTLINLHRPTPRTIGGRWRHVTPFLLTFALLGLLSPLFWGVLLVQVLLYGVGDVIAIHKRRNPRPWYWPDPICLVACSIQTAGGRVRRFKAELLPPGSLIREPGMRQV